MYKKIIAASLLTFTLLPLAALASDKESTINVESSVNKSVDVDTLTMKFYIVNYSMNIKETKDKNDKIAQNAVSKIKQKLSEKEYIKTIAYSISPVYNYANKKRTLQNYEIKNGFEVQLKDFSKASEIVKIATDSGVNEINQTKFYVENTYDICNRLLAQSAKEAQQRASYIASSLGLSLDGVKSINPYCSSESPRMYANFALKSNSQDSAVASTEAAAGEIFEPGQTNIRASVNMTYYLK